MLYDEEGVPRIVQRVRAVAPKMIELLLFNGWLIALTVEHASDISNVTEARYYRYLDGPDPTDVYADLEYWVSKNWDEYAKWHALHPPEQPQGLQWPPLPSS